MIVYDNSLSTLSPEHKPKTKKNNMDKFLENQASNHAFHCASVWHNSKKDHDSKRYFESEKKITLYSYSNRPEFAEKFNAVLAYYMVRENFIKASNE